MLELAGLAIAVLVPAWIYGPRSYSALLATFLTTEFYYVPIAGGRARPYHFIAALTVLKLARALPGLIRTRLLWSLGAFFVVCLVSSVLSESPAKALESQTLLFGNLLMALAVAQMLILGKVSPDQVKAVVLSSAVLGVAVSVAQIAAFRLVGVNLGLSAEQESQIPLGFGPGLRTEANTFGKFLTVPMMMLLPDLLERRGGRRVRWALATLGAGFALNLTRSAVYGLALAAPLLIAWNAAKGRAVKLVWRTVATVSLVAVAILALDAVDLRMSDYGRYKLEHLFSQQELTTGSSGSYRLSMMTLIINDVTGDPKKMLFGNGWGQTKYEFMGQEVRAGGGDLIVVLGYAGLLGAASYAAYSWVAVRTAVRAKANAMDHPKARFGESVAYALVPVLITAQMAGYLIAPEYWLLIGSCLYLSATAKKRPVLVGGT